MEFSISPDSAVPIYRQIADHVRRAVARGDVKPGDRLPSVRSLASRLVVNQNTVSKAYAHLIRDGVIESRQGRGVFVAQARQVYSSAERRRRLRAAIESLVSEALLLGFSADRIRRSLDQALREFEKPERGRKSGEVPNE